MNAPHGADGETGVFDALKDFAGQAPLHGVRLDDGQRSLGHPAIIAVSYAAAPFHSSAKRWKSLANECSTFWRGAFEVSLSTAGSSVHTERSSSKPRDS